MKISLVVFSVATILAHTAFAQPSSASMSSQSATSIPSVAAEPEPVKLESGQIDFSKMDPNELESIYQEIEEDALLKDMVDSGWPTSQAQMVLSLTDIVESLTHVPKEDENNEQLLSSFSAVRETMRDILASAGLEFHNSDQEEESSAVFSRLMTKKQVYSEENAVTVVSGLVNLMRTASKITAMLNNPSLAQYGTMISSAVQMLESLLGTAKGLISPDTPAVNVAPQ